MISKSGHDDRGVGGPDPGAEFENVRDYDPLMGSWVTPFAGYIHVDPFLALPTQFLSVPELAAYRPNPDYDPAADPVSDPNAASPFFMEGGYWPSAALITLFFDGRGGIDGDIHINRGGSVGAFGVLGTYHLRLDSVRWFYGEFTLNVPGPSGFIERGFRFFLRDFNHMEWVMLTATAETDPATSILTVITSGTFTRANERAF